MSTRRFPGRVVSNPSTHKLGKIARADKVRGALSRMRWHYAYERITEAQLARTESVLFAYIHGGADLARQVARLVQE